MLQTDSPIIVRIAPEVSLKSARTRKVFQRTLVETMHRALDGAGIAHRIRHEAGRLIVTTPADAQARGVDVLCRVFGIASVSPVERVVAPELEAIVAAGTEVFGERVKGRGFAVRAKRTGKQAFRSVDVQQALGAALNREPTARVDLTAPDVTLHVEVQAERAYLFGERLTGAGGLPVGTQGRALALMSGGFDSPVAAWRIMRRGVAVDFVFCNLAGATYERMVLEVAKRLTDTWGAGSEPKLHLIDFAEVVDHMREHVRGSYWQVVLKRLMYRAASAVAAETGAEALITGEAIGQVSSQTLSNLAAIEPAADRPVLRPLVGADKTDIIADARHVGTAELSERIHEFCNLSTVPPVTASKPAVVEREEARLDPAVLARAVAGRRTLDLATTDPKTLRTGYLFVDHVPEDAIIIDCQPPAGYRTWHLAGAENRDPADLARSFRKLDKGRTYFLYCENGVEAPYLAELMQEQGFQAYAFDGDLADLRARAGAA